MLHLSFVKSKLVCACVSRTWSLVEYIYKQFMMIHFYTVIAAAITKEISIDHHRRLFYGLKCEIHFRDTSASRRLFFLPFSRPISIRSFLPRTSKLLISQRKKKVSVINWNEYADFKIFFQIGSFVGTYVTSFV